jgi:hypothetical protein
MRDMTSFDLAIPGQRLAAIECVRSVPVEYLVEVRKTTRSALHNRFAHALWNDLAKSATFAGKRLTMQQWKVLMISAHSVATGRPSEVMPGIEGEWVDLRESSARMSDARLASVMEYTMAWMAQNDIPLNEAAQARRAK